MAAHYDAGGDKCSEEEKWPLAVCVNRVGLVGNAMGLPRAPAGEGACACARARTRALAPMPTAPIRLPAQGFSADSLCRSIRTLARSNTARLHVTTQKKRVAENLQLWAQGTLNSTTRKH